VRFILFFLIPIISIASEFPEIFSSAGDEVFSNMQRYEKIKNLDIYKDRPELLEAYCMDANISMQKGFALDKRKDDPELAIDKDMIKSYAKELRTLSNQNEQIVSQLDKELGIMYNNGDFVSLKRISEAGFHLSEKMMHGITNYEKQESQRKDFALIKKKIKKEKEALKIKNKSQASKPKFVPLVKEKLVVIVPKQEKVIPIIEPKLQVEIAKKERIKPKVKAPKKTKLQYYEKSLHRLKDELYNLRESHEEEKMACLNDITAINYWMISVLQNSNESCARADAIRQMKSYNKASAFSCGRDSLRYVEWRGRIKPYVGRKLFEAEAGCNK